MASDISIPGEELQQVRDLLSRVHDHIDTGRDSFDFDRALGPRSSDHRAAQHFESKWNDGKHQLQKQIQSVGDAVGNILDSFQKADQDAAANLDSGTAK
ncbi:hypothetical protein ACLMNJ_15510 [Streptomyces seoulensis]